jgi:hypothetical protein
MLASAGRLQETTTEVAATWTIPTFAPTGSNAAELMAFELEPGAEVALEATGTVAIRPATRRAEIADARDFLIDIWFPH